MWNLAGACVCIRRRRRCACSSVKFWAKIARARMCSRACWRRTVKDAQPTWFEHGGTIVKPSGVVMGPTVVACERKGTGEPTLLRGLRPVLKPGDILLVDALLAAWWIIAEARAAGVDIVMPQHGRRLTDCTRCQSLGKKDPLVVWPRPQRPKWMSVEAYGQYPVEMVMHTDSPGECSGEK